MRPLQNKKRPCVQAKLMLLTALTSFLAMCHQVSGDTLYGTTYYQVPYPTVYELNPSTGAVIRSTPVSHAESLRGLTWQASSRKLFAIDGYNDETQDRLFRIDPQTGSGTVIGNMGGNFNYRSVDFDAAGKLWFLTDNRLYGVNTLSGQVGQPLNINTSGLPHTPGNQLTSLAISPNGTFYASRSTGGINTTGQLVEINPTSGVATLVANFSSSGTVSDMAFDSSGNLWGLLDTNTEHPGLVTINLATAYLDDIGQLPSGTVGITFDVPEPATLSLVILGGLALLRRRNIE